jgi:hypothetical protein
MMRTLDHAVEEEFSRSQFPSEEEEGEEEEWGLECYSKKRK